MLDVISKKSIKQDNTNRMSQTLYNQGSSRADDRSNSKIPRNILDQHNQDEPDSPGFSPCESPKGLRRTFLMQP